MTFTINVKEPWFSSLSRMGIEYLANDVFHRCAPSDVPAVCSYDSENFIMIREAAPEACRMWKTDLLEGMFDYKVATNTIDALLAVHNTCATDQDVARDFSDKQEFYNLRVAPYIEFTVKRHPELKERAEPLVDLLMNSAITLVHGDFSPKNIMVLNRRIYILDFEVAHYGHPAFDLAFFSCHFILKSIKNKKYAPAYLDMLEFMVERYFSMENFMDKKILESIYVRILAFLLLARVDGKSPVEYLEMESDRNIVREVSHMVAVGDFTSFAEVRDCVNTSLHKERE